MRLNFYFRESHIYVIVHGHSSGVIFNIAFLASFEDVDIRLQNIMSSYTIYFNESRKISV